MHISQPVERGRGGNWLASIFKLGEARVDKGVGALLRSGSAPMPPVNAATTLHSLLSRGNCTGLTVSLSRPLPSISQSQLPMASSCQTHQGSCRDVRTRRWPNQGCCTLSFFMVVELVMESPLRRVPE